MVLYIFPYHRHYGEFEDLDLLLKQHLKLWRTFPWTLPEEEDANIVNLSAYLAALMTNDQIRWVLNFKETQIVVSTRNAFFVAKIKISRF